MVVLDGLHWGGRAMLQCHASGSLKPIAGPGCARGGAPWRGLRAGSYTPTMGLFGAFWGVGGFAAVLVVTIYRLTPEALDTFSNDLQWYHWSALIVSAVLMAYFEGYRGFQHRLAPRMAARAKYLAEHPTMLRVVLSPLFCVGYFHATRRRKISAYALTSAIVVLVALVRLLGDPWRGIVDIGVIVGLSWGLLSLLAVSARAFSSDGFAHSPEVPSP